MNKSHVSHLQVKSVKMKLVATLCNIFCKLISILHLTKSMFVSVPCDLAKSNREYFP